MAYGFPDWLTGGPSSSSTATPTSQHPKSKDGGYVAPDRNARELCYESRDIFFECLDKHDILDANKDDALAREKCPQEVGEYERDCARSWIKYFKEKRVMEYKRDLTIERIKKEDSDMAEQQKKARRGKGWFS